MALTYLLFPSLRRSHSFWVTSASSTAKRERESDWSADNFTFIVCAHTRRELSLLLSRLSVLRHGIRTDHMNGGVKRNETRIWSGHNDQRPISPRHTTRPTHSTPLTSNNVSWRIHCSLPGPVMLLLQAASSERSIWSDSINSPRTDADYPPLTLPFPLWPQGEKEHFLSGHPPI